MAAKNKKNVKKAAISARMSIADVISKYPETMEVFLRRGLHCFGCMGAGFENLRAAAKIHGVGLADLLKDLNRVVDGEKKSKAEKIRKMR